MAQINLKFEALKTRKKKGQFLEQVIIEDLHCDSFPQSPNQNIKTNNVAFAVINPETIINGYFDMIGRFPQRLSSGKQYIMVGYNYDANSILAHTMKDYTAKYLYEL